MHSEPAPPDWYLFEIPVSVILDYLERVTGAPFPESPDSSAEAHKWHLALRKGLHTPLHLNVGIPGFEDPGDPIEENPSAIHAALLMGVDRIQVILSGEWEVALAEGLITHDQLRLHRAALIALGD